MGAKIYMIGVLSFLALPSTAVIIDTFYTEHPTDLGAIIVEYEGSIFPLCTGILISTSRVITSCFCVNLALQSVRSRQGRFYGSTVRYAVGMTSLDPTDFKKQLDANAVYTYELDYRDIKCPGTDMTDTKFFRNDLAIIEVGTVPLAEYDLSTGTLTVDDEPTEYMPGCYTTSWSSGTSCVSLANIRRNYAPLWVVDCASTIIENHIVDTQFCARYNASVLLDLGDNGAPTFYTPNMVNYIQFGVSSYQRKTSPYQAGCTRRKEAQVNTRLKPYADWLRKTAPCAKYSTIADIMKMG